ncbi:MAG: 16S rRNA (guanine(966)-N(2))-methyltransferase [Candidatus Ozemobacter sibiricus]|jgi:16S rRNA (guanine(966)-N(2))-methyltransferase RsmD|uniref:16S rRNA (Guanine(966)-N(2))-methyltransferase n=1 Tax=Candidatus Ozemobacter sibiricus TaxID=2268124 RepID=A0A367ZSJ7_9BACT|nr:MAG: 16S rRNA (guanine(966)-N(2))-methyltransferase [Candidatus Ozemobacter sibiricus]
MTALRVATGTAKGRPLKMPRGGKTRPAMNRVKQSLFSILAARLPDCRFLDLFAGSGSLGIEALSRGASFAAFVDHSPECARTIRENLALTGFTAQGRVYCQDCLKFLARPDLEPFDLVCIDPPYLKGLLTPILDALPSCPLFTPRTIFIIERQKKDDLGLAGRPALELFDERTFGDTVLTFFRIRPPSLAPATGDPAPAPPTPGPSA